MTNEQILQSLTTVFRDVFDNPALVLTYETTADDIEDWDSYNHINLIVAAEARFGIKFLTSELESLKNVGEFVDLIYSKTA